ncbi:MAG TPA: cyclic pyranopterin monophosphate synthase MoaC [Opitutaceae bacterium]|jgi:cyclic pyranopterin phosphate synthase|nr:cyclic pyranopterin monophosphate synthase MoaC [Opitutaceae bacterium]
MLSHVDAQGRPRMVDVGGKPVTRRTAHAIAVVELPPALAGLLQDGDIATKKGPVFQTAILAGTMGAKRTAELIPLCHPLPLDACTVEIETRPARADGSAEAVIHCRVEVHARTGAEMEALTGASIAALALYDMGKAAAPGIVIREVRLLEKTGGKTDYRAEA